MFASYTAAIIFSISAWRVSCEKIGETVCAEGNVVDVFCIERGNLLENPRLKTLENPELHTLHCLVDVSWCIDSGYEILLDPTLDRALYKRGYRLDRYGNDMVIQLARDSGDTARCSTCTNKLGLSMTNGFRATVKGTITALRRGEMPATVAVTSVEESSVGCGDSTNSSSPITTSASSTKSSPAQSGNAPANSTVASQSPTTISSVPAGASAFSGASTTNSGTTINLTSIMSPTVMENQTNSIASNSTPASVAFKQIENETISLFSVWNSSLFTP